MSEDRTPVRASYLDRVKPQARLHKPEPPRRCEPAEWYWQQTQLCLLLAVKMRFDRDLSVRNMSLLGSAVLQPRPEGPLSEGISDAIQEKGASHDHLLGEPH